MTALATRVARTIRHYVFDHDVAGPWLGPVERRDPAVVRQRSVHLTWRCVNEFCRNWTMHGAYEWGRCNFCQTPRGVQ